MSKLRISNEKELLIGLIVSDDFIRQISPILHISYLQATSSVTIVNWCVDYFYEYNCAPKSFIQDIFTQNKRNLKDDDADMIAKVLAHVSSKYTDKDKYNVPYAVDKARKYIEERKIIMLRDNLDEMLIKGDLEKAQNAILSFTKVTKQEHKTTNLWKNSEIITNIFNKERNKLFRLPGVIGEYIGDIERDNLYAFAGVAKRGKSRWLAQTAIIASLKRLNTLYISLEMSEEETGELLFNSLARKPLRDSKQQVQVKLPYFNEDNDILYNEFMEDSAVEDDFRKWQKKANMACGTMHQHIGEPDNLTLEEIDALLVSLEYLEDFKPDVIVIDYANLLRVTKYTDNRDKVNTIWTGLKRMAKHWHCAVITASHMSGDALKKDAENYNIGEDKRILNHVTGLYILNQTEDEKDAKIMRIKSTATRFSRYSGNDEVVCLYDFDTGRTLIDSKWKKDVPEYNEE